MSADSLQVKQYKAYIEKLKEANEEQLKVIELQNKMIENQELIISHKDEEIELLEKQMDHLLIQTRVSLHVRSPVLPVRALFPAAG